MAKSKNFDINVIFRAFDRLSAPMKKMGAGLSNFSRKAEKVGKKMGEVGKTLTTRLTLPILAIGAIATKVAVTFEDSMLKVKAITGTTGKEFDKLTKTAEKLGEKTRFTAAEAAQAMVDLGQAGFDTNEILEAIPGVLDLAAASGVSLSRAAEITSNTMRAFGIETKDVSRVIDVLAKTTTSSNVNMEELFEAMKFIAPIAKGMGVSIEETSAFIGTLGNAGIKGSLATATFGTALTKLAKPSTLANKIMKELGLEAFDAQGEFKGFNGLIEETEKALVGLNPKLKQAVLAEIFGQRAVKQILVLTEAGSESMRDFTKELDNAQGTAKKMAEIMESGLGGVFRRLRSVTQALAISFVKVMIPAMKKLTEKIIKITAWFTNLDKKTKKTIVKFLLIAAAAGPVLLILSKITLTVASLSKGLGFLGKAMNPKALLIIAIIAAITTLVVLLVRWQKKSQGITKTFEKIRNAIKKATKTVVEFIRSIKTSALVFASVFLPIVGIPALIIKKWAGIKTFFSDLVAKVKEIFSDLKEFFTDIFLDILDSPAFKSLIAKFEKVSKLASKVKGFAGGVAGAARETATGIATRGFEIAKSAIFVKVEVEGKNGSISTIKDVKSTGNVKFEIKNKSLLGNQTPLGAQ